MKSAVDETAIQKHLALRGTESGVKSNSTFTKNVLQSANIPIQPGAVQRRGLRQTNQVDNLSTPKLMGPGSAKFGVKPALGDDFKSAKVVKQGGALERNLVQKRPFSPSGPLMVSKATENANVLAVCGDQKICGASNLDLQSTEVVDQGPEFVNPEEKESASGDEAEESDDEIEHGPPISFYFAEADASESFASTLTAASQHTTLGNVSLASNANYAACDSWNAALYDDSTFDETRMSDYVKVLLERFAVRRVPGDGGVACAFGESSQAPRPASSNWRWHLFERDNASSAEASVRKAPFRDWDAPDPLVAKELERVRNLPHRSNEELGFLALDTAGSHSFVWSASGEEDSFLDALELDSRRFLIAQQDESDELLLR